MNNPKLLQVNNLSISYGDQILVNEVSFSVHKNQFIGITGESGSGKTLTTKAILQLLPKELNKTGEGIQFLDDNERIDLCSLSFQELTQIRGKKIAAVFQDAQSALNPAISCGKQIQETILKHFPAKTKKELHDETIELLIQFGFEEPKRISASFIHEISGGQRQRIMLAIALSAKPALLIADEFTTSLDEKNREAVLKALKDYQTQEKLSVLLISHDLKLIQSVCDACLIMQKGKIVEMGPTQELFNHPQNRYTQDLFNTIKPQTSSARSIHPNELIRAEGIDKSYFSGIIKRQETKVFQSFSMHIQVGEWVSLVGKSGSGKSTLSKIIAKALLPEGGKVFYKGKSLFGKDFDLINYKKEVQLILQDTYSSFNPYYKIEVTFLDILKHFKLFDKRSLRHSKGAKEYMLTILSSLGLEQRHLESYPNQLSGGEIQRLSIARALILKPQLLICDEIVSSLDKISQYRVLQILKDLQHKQNIAILFISHDMELVREYSDRIVEISNK